MINLNVLLKKKEGKKYLHIWGVALFILKLKNWKADVTILNMCTFVWIHFDLVGLIWMAHCVDKDHADLVVSML